MLAGGRSESDRTTAAKEEEEEDRDRGGASGKEAQPDGDGGTAERESRRSRSGVAEPGHRPDQGNPCTSPVFPIPLLPLQLITSLLCPVVQSVHQQHHHHHKASPSLAGFPTSLVSSPSLKAQMELLQQQQQQAQPTAAHRANGSLDAELPIMRRRRGRRKNVEGLELLFMANKRGAAVCWATCWCACVRAAVAL